MKERILHITPYYLPHFGGVEQVTYDIVNILKEKYENHVICFSETTKSFEDDYEGVRVYRVGYFKKIASQAISLSYLFKLRAVLKEINPKYIHVHLPNPLITFYINILWLYSKEFRGIKIIAHWHSDIIRQKKMLIFYGKIQDTFLSKTYKIIATSPNYIDSSSVLMKNRDKVEVVQNIVDVNKLKYSEIVSEKVKEIKNRYKNKKIVFFIGVHRKYKGLKYLIEAEKYLDQNTIVIIAGQGAETERLKAMSKNIERIKFLGKISNLEKIAYFYASDVFAFPSITKNEAFGVALAEALYCGLPAVTFKINGSGVNWVNKNRVTGIEVEVHSAKKFANAINQIEKETYSKKCKERVEKLFTSDKIKVKLFRIYEQGVWKD